jgi:membrane protease YdiL (CAAX protease family)
VLAAVNVADKYGPHHTGLIAGPIVALALVLLARRAGLTWHDLGLSKRTLVPGLKYAVGAIGAGRDRLRRRGGPAADPPGLPRRRYHLHLSAALLTAFIVVPLGTVLLEEVAFRGVLLGLVRRHRSATWASITSSVLFGLWHILPSLRLNHANQAIGAALGTNRARRGADGGLRGRLHRGGRGAAQRAAPAQRQPAGLGRVALGHQRDGPAGRRRPGHGPLRLIIRPSPAT